MSIPIWRRRRNAWASPSRVPDALVIKKYPSCGGNHAMLDSIFGLMRDHGFGHQDVANAEVTQSYASTVMLYEEPETDLKGKFSAKYNMAAALVDGRIGIDTFTPDRVAADDVQDMMGRVTMRVQSKWEQGGGTVSKGRADSHHAERRAGFGARNPARRHPGQPGQPLGRGQHRRQVPGECGPGAAGGPG